MCRIQCNISAQVIEAYVSTYSLDGFCESTKHVIQHSIALGLSELELHFLQHYSVLREVGA